MKKVLLILTLGVFALGSSSFKSIDEMPGVNCDEYAAQAWVDAVNDGYSGFIAFIAYTGYWNACMDTGGYSNQEVTIIGN